MASVLSVYSGMGLAIIILVGYLYFSESFDFITLVSIIMAIMALFAFALYKLLMTIGVKSFNKLNV